VDIAVLTIIVRLVLAGDVEVDFNALVPNVLMVKLLLLDHGMYLNAHHVLLENIILVEIVIIALVENINNIPVKPLVTPAAVENIHLLVLLHVLSVQRVNTLLLLLQTV
jgi:hypothetical protein